MKNPLSLEAFADWLATMPADREYDYQSNNGCAFCLYLDFLGIQYFGVGGDYWRDREGACHPLPYLLAHKVLAYPPWTFGAALERARTVLASA